MARDFELDDVTLGNEDHEGEDVRIARSEVGSVVVLPASVAKLRGPAHEVVAEIQRTALEIHRLHDRLEDLVLEARAEGVAWSAIGWCVGISAQGAQQRWGRDE